MIDEGSLDVVSLVVFVVDGDAAVDFGPITVGHTRLSLLWGSEETTHRGT